MKESNAHVEPQRKSSLKFFSAIGSVIALIAVLVFVVWWLRPWFVVWTMHLADKKGEASSRAVCDRIVAQGERAVPAIISSIEANSPWVRRHSYLPIALKEIGGSAHNALLRAIKRQADPLRRAYLVSSLQTGFNDFSRLQIVLDDMRSGMLSDFAMNFFASEVLIAFPEAPPLVTEGGALNIKFVDWWAETNSNT